MHFDTLPLTNAIYVTYCEPGFDLGQMYQEITMPERGWGMGSWGEEGLELNAIHRVVQLCH